MKRVFKGKPQAQAAGPAVAPQEVK
jgi:hypothetical protein